MSLILTRSPFFVKNEGGNPSAQARVEIEKIIGDSLETEVLKTYVLNFYRQNEIDISPLIDEFINRQTITSTLGFRPVRVKVTSPFDNGSTISIESRYYVACNGYFEFEQGYNYDAEDYLVDNVYYTGSTDCIYVLDDNEARINLLSPKASADSLEDVTIDVLFIKDGDIVGSTIVSMTSESNAFANQVFNVPTWRRNFEARVGVNDGVFEGNYCNDAFFDEYSVEDYDTIRLEDRSTGNTKDIKVKRIEECKYKPILLTFINKFGRPEDLYFFKRSDKSLNTSSEIYRRNTFGRTPRYHVYKKFNVNGKESMVLNSGYVPEEFYESFKQMYLSESIWAYLDDDSNTATPVNIKSTNLVEKLHRNEKLINYEIEIEFAFDTIGNIV